MELQNLELIFGDCPAPKIDVMLWKEMTRITALEKSVGEWEDELCLEELVPA